MDVEKESFKRTLSGLEHALGEEILGYMADTNIFEIMLNPDGKLWVDTFDKGEIFTGIHLSASKGKQIICSVAAIAGRILDAKCPILEAEVPDTQRFPMFRFEGLLPNIVKAPAFDIRKHEKMQISLEDYVQQGVMTDVQKQVVLDAIHKKKNIMVAGGTASGKTTFVNAVLEEISKFPERILLIEDTKELRCAAKDHISLCTTDHVDMKMLLRSALRLRPKRIIVGEVRNEETLILLDAWSTGHRGGCSTIHSDSAYDTLLRLENMTSRTARNPQQATIGHAIDVIVYLTYEGLKRKVEEILAVEKYDPIKKDYITHHLG
jgi:type IV secretion system protein TrbB